MTWLSLVRTGLWRKPTRTVLTTLSLTVAFVLFMLLRALGAAITGGTSVPGVQRLLVDAKYAMTDNLPLTAVQSVREMPGVTGATQMSWFGGYYQDPAHAFAKAPVDQTQYFQVFPELVIADDVLARFQASRRAVVVPVAMAEEYGWRTGDLVPIVGDIWPKSDGSWNWEFEVAGTYEVPPGSILQPWFLLRYDYFNESVADWAKNEVGWVVARLDDGVDPKVVVDAIDGRFENSSDPTRSLSEDEWSRQFANQLGDIGLIATLILGTVFFTMLLLTANVAALAFRERVPELAVMKALGFKDRTAAVVVLSEALALCLMGVVGGITIGFALEMPLNAQLAPVVGRFQMSWVDAGLALGIAGGLGLAIGLPPAAAAKRLSIVRALREISQMFKQTAVVTRMSLESLGSRAAPSATVVVGSAAVVAVLLGLLAMSSGFRSALVDTAKPDRGLILRNGSNNEMDGWIGLQELAILDAYEGLDVTSGEIYTTLTVPKRGAGTTVDVVCRGVTAAAFTLRPELRIVSGRTLVPGRNEVIVGTSAARQYAGLDVGDRVQARTTMLEVVGHFVAEGAAAESEVWMDRAIAQSVFRRTSAVSVARVKLAADADVQTLNQRLAADPRLTSTLIPEQEFFAAQSASRAALIDTFAYLIAGIMALGSVFGALATMFTAVSRRSVEIATLRALGFRSVPVVVSVLVEATVLALAGGVLGAAIVYAVLDGYTASTLNPAAGSQLAFAFRVTPESIGLEVRHEEARLDLHRQRRLLDQRLIGQADFDATQADADSLEARIANQREQEVVAEREIDVRRTAREDTVIRAPFSGVAISRDAQPGEIISPMSAGGGFTRTGVCTIVDMSSLEIEVDVNESYIDRVSPGQRVVASLNAYPDWEIPARVHHDDSGRRSPARDGPGAYRVRRVRRPSHPAGHGR